MGRPPQKASEGRAETQLAGRAGGGEAAEVARTTSAIASASAMSELAGLLHEQGKLTEAEELYRCVGKGTSCGVSIVIRPFFSMFRMVCVTGDGGTRRLLSETCGQGKLTEAQELLPVGRIMGFRLLLACA